MLSPYDSHMYMYMYILCVNCCRWYLHGKLLIRIAFTTHKLVLALIPILLL